MREQEQPRRQTRCLEEGQLMAWYDGALSQAEAKSVMSHLATCARCAALERSLRNDRRQVFALLSIIDPQPDVTLQPAAALVHFRERLAASRSGNHLSPPLHHSDEGDLPGTWSLPASAAEQENLLPIALPAPSPRRRWISLQTLVAALIIAVMLGSVLLIGGASGIFGSQGHAPAGLPTPSILSLQVSPSTIAFGGTITLRGSYFSPNGQVGLFRDNAIPLLDTGFKSIIRADASGSFQDTVTINGHWTAGLHTIYAEDARLHKTASFGIQVTGHGVPSLPAHLLLSSNSVDLGSGDQTTSATQSITLQNSGGGQINWQATTQPSWLLLSPQSGTISGGQTMPVELAGERSNLNVGTYKADVIFTWDSVPITLPVQMKVTPLEKGHEALLQATPAALSFTAVDGGLSPSAQVVTISNPGVLPLNWSASSATIDGTNWLSASPQSGAVANGDSQPVTISVNSSALLPGVYYGSITFTNQSSEAAQNSSQTIYVSLTIQLRSIHGSPGMHTSMVVFFLLLAQRRSGLA